MIEVTEKVELYTLSLTADELTWLLLEVFPAAAREADFAADIQIAKDAWWDEANKQGWRPF